MPAPVYARAMILDGHLCAKLVPPGLQIPRFGVDAGGAPAQASVWVPVTRPKRPMIVLQKHAVILIRELSACGLMKRP
jgi:hypothetical protein